jgi:hypothetical protein
MTETIENEFLTTPALGAATDWVVAFPTKRYYVDPQIPGTPFAPFDETFGAHDYGDVHVTGQSRIVYDASIYDREERGFCDVRVRVHLSRRRLSANVGVSSQCRELHS